MKLIKYKISKGTYGISGLCITPCKFTNSKVGAIYCTRRCKNCVLHISFLNLVLCKRYR